LDRSLGGINERKVNHKLFIYRSQSPSFFGVLFLSKGDV
jgi:hypothetical protein